MTNIIIPLFPSLSVFDPDARMLLKQIDILLTLTDMHDMLVSLKRFEEADKYHIAYQAVRVAIDGYAADVRGRME